MQRRTLMNLMALGVLLAKAPFAAAEGDDMVRITKPLNVAMLTGGDYDRYRQILLAFAQGLGRLEMIESAPAGLSPERKDTADVWEALAENAGGHYLRFLPDAHYSYDFTPEKRPEVLRSMVSRIRERKDVDLILVFGTEPTLDIAEAVKDIPIMSLSTTDPVNSGVVADEEDSGQDNLHVLVTKDFFFRQVENLYAIHPFKDIGFIVAEQRAGRTGLGDVRAACVKLGMTLHDATYIEKEVPEDSERFPEFKEALVKLLDEGVEAVLFPWFPCSNSSRRCSLSSSSAASGAIRLTVRASSRAASCWAPVRRTLRATGSSKPTCCAGSLSTTNSRAASRRCSFSRTASRSICVRPCRSAGRFPSRFWCPPKRSTRRRVDRPESKRKCRPEGRHFVCAQQNQMRMRATG